MKKAVKLLLFIISITLIIQMFNSPLISNATTAEKLVDKSQTLSVISDELYCRNVEDSIEQSRILRKDEEFKKYDTYLDDNGILTLMVFDDENEDIEYGEEISSELFKNHRKIQKAFSDANLDSKEIIYRKVKFGKQYLLNIQDVVTKHAKKEYGIISIGSGDIYNQVEIELLDIEKSKDILYLLEQNIDNFSKDAVRFLESEPVINYAKRSHPGRHVWNVTDVSDYGGTSGFNAKDKQTGNYGIVTAAHIADQNLTLYNANNDEIGIPTHWQKANSMDAAFVPFVSGYSPSCAINGNTNRKFVGYVKAADIEKQMKVSKFGNSTNETSGIVLDEQCNVTIDGVSFTRLVKMELQANGGDSGGPVYLNQAYKNYKALSLIGIITGGNGYYTYATKAGFILATFNLELYTG